jgi:hypothetical protein
MPSARSSSQTRTCSLNLCDRCATGCRRFCLSTAGSLAGVRCARVRVRARACARACVRVRRAQLRRGPSRHSGRGWLAGAAVGGGVLNSASRRSAVPAGRSRDMPAVSGYGKLSTRGTRRPRFRLTLAIGVPRECAGLGEAGSSGEAPQASVVLVSNRARCQHDVASCSRRNAS